MRRLSPAIVYAISPAGEVVRRFTIDPQNPDYMPLVLHTSGNRIAILFREPQTRQELIKTIDLEGREIATYEERMNGTYGELGSAFACYSQNPERSYSPMRTATWAFTSLSHGNALGTSKLPNQPSLTCPGSRKPSSRPPDLPAPTVPRLRV